MELPYNLRMLIRDNTTTTEAEVKIIDAVEEYSSALLRQTDCSMLREILVKMLKREKRRYVNRKLGAYEQNKAFHKIAPLEKVIEMIDERQPVA